MKELTLNDVMRIAGGVPPAAALDEINYRAPESTPARDGLRAPDDSIRPSQAD